MLNCASICVAPPPFNIPMREQLDRHAHVGTSARQQRVLCALKRRVPPKQWATWIQAWQDLPLRELRELGDAQASPEGVTTKLSSSRGDDGVHDAANTWSCALPAPLAPTGKGGTIGAPQPTSLLAASLLPRGPPLGDGDVSGALVRLYVVRLAPAVMGFFPRMRAWWVRPPPANAPGRLDEGDVGDTTRLAPPATPKPSVSCLDDPMLSSSPLDGS